MKTFIEVVSNQSCQLGQLSCYRRSKYVGITTATSAQCTIGQSVTGTEEFYMYNKRNEVQLRISPTWLSFGFLTFSVVSVLIP